jgi:hypothetical protein
LDEQPAGLLNAFQTVSTFAARPLINIHDLAVADIGWVRFAVFHGAWILPLWDSSEQALAMRAKYDHSMNKCQ